MSTKYYRVKKDTFMWREGAILQYNQALGSDGGYEATEDVWDAIKLDGEYISTRIIESEENSQFFERVYPDTLKGNIYRTKEQVIELYNKSFKK
jgi:hypothetical protein